MFQNNLPQSGRSHVSPDGSVGWEVVTPASLPDAEQAELKRDTGREVAAAILEGQPLEQVARLINDIVALRLRVERVGLYLRDERGVIVPIALRNIFRRVRQVHLAPGSTFAACQPRAGDGTACFCPQCAGRSAVQR